MADQFEKLVDVCPLSILAKKPMECLEHRCRAYVPQTSNTLEKTCALTSLAINAAQFVAIMNEAKCVTGVDPRSD